MLTEFIGWVLRTVTTAAEAERNDDSVLREQLLEAELRRELGELSDEEFREVEADLLSRIREIKVWQGGGGPLTTGGAVPLETTSDSTFQVEATVAGDFYDPDQAPHTTIVESEPDYVETIAVSDMERGPRSRRKPSRRTLRKS